MHSENLDTLRQRLTTLSENQRIDEDTYLLAQEELTFLSQEETTNESKEDRYRLLLNLIEGWLPEESYCEALAKLKAGTRFGTPSTDLYLIDEQCNQLTADELFDHPTLTEASHRSSLQEPAPESKASSSQLSSGVVLASRYELLEYQGGGGMGEVWIANDRTRQDKVAIKFLPRDMQNNHQEEQRMQNVFRQMGRIHHQNICPVHDLRNDREHGLYFVMKYIPGQTLSQYYQSYRQTHQTFPLSEVVRCLTPIAKALDYLHKKGIVHRDVKPENILIDQMDQEPQLIDFGLALETAGEYVITEEPTYEFAGSLPYVAPEQWRRDVLEGPTDQYGLAVVAYQLLSGQLPFPLKPFQEMKDSVLRGSVKGLPQQAGTVNEALARGLAKDPRERFPSCVKFIEALAVDQDVEETFRIAMPTDLKTEAKEEADSNATAEQKSQKPGETDKTPLDNSASQMSSLGDDWTMMESDDWLKIDGPSTSDSPSNSAEHCDANSEESSHAFSLPTKTSGTADRSHTTPSSRSERTNKKSEKSTERATDNPTSSENRSSRRKESSDTSQKKQQSYRKKNEDKGAKGSSKHKRMHRSSEKKKANSSSDSDMDASSNHKTSHSKGWFRFSIPLALLLMLGLLGWYGYVIYYPEQKATALRTETDQLKQQVGPLRQHLPDHLKPLWNIAHDEKSRAEELFEQKNFQEALAAFEISHEHFVLTEEMTTAIRKLKTLQQESNSLKANRWANQDLIAAEISWEKSLLACNEQKFSQGNQHLKATVISYEKAIATSKEEWLRLAKLTSQKAVELRRSCHLLAANLNSRTEWFTGVDHSDVADTLLDERKNEAAIESYQLAMESWSVALKNCQELQQQARDLKRECQETRQEIAAKGLTPAKTWPQWSFAENRFAQASRLLYPDQTFEESIKDFQYSKEQYLQVLHLMNLEEQFNRFDAVLQGEQLTEVEMNTYLPLRWENYLQQRRTRELNYQKLKQLAGNPELTSDKTLLARMQTETLGYIGISEGMVREEESFRRLFPILKQLKVKAWMKAMSELQQIFPKAHQQESDYEVLLNHIATHLPEWWLDRAVKSMKQVQNPYEKMWVLVELLSTIQTFEKEKIPLTLSMGEPTRKQWQAEFLSLFQEQTTKMTSLDQFERLLHLAKRMTILSPPQQEIFLPILEKSLPQLPNHYRFQPENTNSNSPGIAEEVFTPRASASSLLTGWLMETEHQRQQQLYQQTRDLIKNSLKPANVKFFLMYSQTVTLNIPAQWKENPDWVGFASFVALRAALLKGKASNAGRYYTWGRTEALHRLEQLKEHPTLSSQLFRSYLTLAVLHADEIEAGQQLYDQLQNETAKVSTLIDAQSFSPAEKVELKNRLQRGQNLPRKLLIEKLIEMANVDTAWKMVAEKRSLEEYPLGRLFGTSRARNTKRYRASDLLLWSDQEDPAFRCMILMGIAEGFARMNNNSQ